MYNSTSFYSVSSSTGQLIQGDWTSPQLYGLTTKPISVDIFVHSLNFNDGYANGSLYILKNPVSHVDTFVLNLLRIQPTLSSGTPTPLPTNLVGQRLSTSLQISYYVQCNYGYIGDYCELSQCVNSTGSSVICVSTINGERRLCTYDSTRTHVQNCTYCDYRYGNNTCANLYYSNSSVVGSYFFLIFLISYFRELLMRIKSGRLFSPVCSS